MILDRFNKTFITQLEINDKTWALIKKQYSMQRNIAITEREILTYLYVKKNRQEKMNLDKWKQNLADHKKVAQVRM